MVDTLHPPLSVIVSFPKPNYVNPQTHGPGLLILISILMTLGIAIVALRIYARGLVTKALGVDDIFIVLALIFGIAFSTFNIVGNVKYYNGYHVWDIPPSSYVGHRVNVWITSLCFTLSLCCIKTSVLLFYRRLSVSFTDSFLIAVWIGMVYNFLYVVGFLFTLCFICRPLSSYWLSFDPRWIATHSHQCGSEPIAETLSVIFSSIGDIYSALLPMLLVRGLKMPRRRKIALYILFGFGFSAVMSGLARIAYVYRMLNVTYDFTWTLYKVWILCHMELWTALFAASAPALKPLVERYATQLTNSVTSTKSLKMRWPGNRGHGTYGSKHGTRDRSTEGYVDIESGEHGKLGADGKARMYYQAKIQAVLGTEVELTKGDTRKEDRTGNPRVNRS